MVRGGGGGYGQRSAARPVLPVRRKKHYRDDFYTENARYELIRDVRNTTPYCCYCTRP